ncbi:uncharacterized protein I303_106148 [Kwoniella dejecticola CBS 10117]|uniref:Uncharacterized protein n=1 Tax=Kwoniella dejecticola CBS 10117 TaxID=1296121 RepID=A0A1A6A1F0_9TREE|nr:uncharacterized protein I303_06165 [Kwoniella dejecticola CBS 10117]OBR83882.1 hypothetical protein I303_06165 [Kwoniella dejecticola CBS 10117]
MTNAEAGPSRLSTLPRKPSAPHWSTTVLGKHKHKIPPPLPAKPAKSSHPSASTHPNDRCSTLPLKTLQGVSKTRSESTKDGYGREVIFVTRKTGLGMLLGRCRSLVVDEGYTSLILHAIGAAIPQCLLLLHALLDVLPYPKGDKGMWYEIKTGSVECIDEVPTVSSTIKKGDNPEGEEVEEGLEWLNDFGGVEEEKPERQSRIKSTIQVILHISPKPRSRAIETSTAAQDDLRSTAERAQAQAQTRGKEAKKLKRNRPSKAKRQQLANKRSKEKHEKEAMNDEEEMINLQDGPVEETDEEIEEIEM